MEEIRNETEIVEGIASGLEDCDINDNVKSGFLDYAMSVIVSRALPDVRDGFKPVHRRIIYAMSESGYTPEKPHVKSAKIVGDVMGKYHPHGDTAIYDSLVRMAQPFSMRYPLIDGHGNFGNLDGDGAAAMRYTEARLGKLSGYLVKDLKENTVDFIDNYDGSEQEPTVLPSRFPNLLVNGSSGIAVGMATNIPPHNLGEVIDGVIAVANNPDITPLEIMTTAIKGPDFPTGGYILGRSGIKKAYETGNGSIVCRGHAEIHEKPNGRSEIIITKIPYSVNKAALVSKIGWASDEKIIPGISRVDDESSDKTGIRIVIELTKDAVPEVVLNNLYKQTPLQTNFNVQSIAIVDGAPKLLNIVDLLKKYLDFQIEVIERRSQFRLKKAEARLHILEGLILASDNIDEVISIIRASSSDEEAESKLMERFNLSEEQVSAILAMTLRKLVKMEKLNLENEKIEVCNTIENLKHILESKENVKEVVVNELTEIKNKINDDRKTEILDHEIDVNDEDLIAQEETLITLTTSGYIKRMPIDTFHTQNRGGKGLKGMTTNEDDDVNLMVKSHTHTDVLFFTNFGKVYRLRGHRIPEGTRTSKGIPVVNFLNLDETEKVVSIISLDDYNDNTYLFFTTEMGVCKRTALKEFELIRQDGKKAITFKEGDSLLNVKMTDGDALIAIASDSGKMVKFHESNVRVMGRSAAGVTGMNIDEGNKAVSVATSNEGSLVLVITSKGYGKMSKIEDYRLTSRGSKGVITLALNEKKGDLVSMKVVNGDEDLVIITKAGILIRIPLEQVKIANRNTQGVKIINIKDDDVVSSVTVVPHEKESEEILEETSVETPVESNE